MGEGDIVMFGTFKDGTLTDIRTVDQSTFARCPFVIMLLEHYDTETGKLCRCYDPVYRKQVMKAWGYKKRDFARVGIE